jgi:hypothetical protein
MTAIASSDVVNKCHQELLEEVTYLKDQDTAWYRNPFVLTIFGFAAGVVVVEYAK